VSSVHKLLARQLRRFFGAEHTAPAALQPFITAVDDAYRQSDADRALLEHSMETVSEELAERFLLLQGALAESRRTETQLTGTLSVLAATFEATADGLLVVDANRRIVRTNRKFAELWRLPDVILESGDAEQAIAYVRDQLAEPEVFVRTISERYASPDAESFDILRFKDGRVFERYSKPQHIGGVTMGRVWSFRDITQRQQLEDQLRQSQKMEAIGSLAGGIAHDFNNILTVITSHAEFLLADQPADDGQRQDLQQILGAASRAASLTRQLLAFSRKQILRPEVLDVNSVITELVPMLRRLIGEDIEIMTNLAATRVAIAADRSQLEQVLINLAVNARDAMPRGGSLMITTRHVDVADRSELVRRHAMSAGPYVQLMVSDEGRGIAREVIGRIFEPFFTTKEPGKGTGLGLATVHGVVHQSGGEITVESVEGAGTTFKIYLPRVTVADTGTQERASSTRVLTNGSETILLAEDEESVRRLIHRALERHGYSVLPATSSGDAIRLAVEHAQTIDLVLTDVVMPDVSGRELVDRLRVICPGVPVLYTSGYTDDEIIRRGALQPDTSFLQKPFTPSQLVCAVRDALDRRGALAGAGSA
jgi:PAS domain S-box-containing protein